MRTCKTCKHWKRNSVELFDICGFVEKTSYGNIYTEEHLRKELKFNVKLCKHPKIVTNKANVITSDSVIVSVDAFDYYSYKSFYTGESYGCVLHEKEPMKHL